MKNEKTVENFDFSDDCFSHIITTDYPPRNVRPTEHILEINLVATNN